MRNLRYILFALLLWPLSGCKNDQANDVPSFPVSLDLNIGGEYVHFVPDNGFQTLTFTQKRYEIDYIGYAGVLVWIDMEGEYRAADLCCPHCLLREAPVEIDGLFAVCPTCGEHFDLSYGAAIPQKGITRQTLRRFSTYYSPYTRILHVSN